MFTVTEATPEDGDAVGEIHAESWQAVYAKFFSPEFAAEAVRHRRGKWRGVLLENRDTVMLGALDGRPLAYTYFGASPARPEYAEIFGCYAHPDGWGTGVANALMAATLRRIGEQGFGRVHLWTLRDTAQSRRFYRKIGFTESGAVRGHDFGDGNPIDQVEYALILLRPPRSPGPAAR